MIQRMALLVGGLGAAVVIALAIALNSFASAGSGQVQAADAQVMPTDVPVVAAANQPAQTAANSGRNDGAQTKQKTVVDKVYVAPAGPPKVIRVNPNTPATNQPAATPKPAPQAPAATPSWHDDGGYDDGHQESEHEGHSGGHHERGDD